MSRIDVIKGRIQTATKEILGEEISYNGITILAVPEIGATLDTNVGLSLADMADTALFTISEKDVPSPTPGDQIIYKNKMYEVQRTQLRDSLGGLYLVECLSKSRLSGRSR